MCCRGDQFSYMIHGEDTPDPGPELPTRYQPGQPGQHGSTVAGDCQDVAIMCICKSYHIARRRLDRG